MTWRWIVLCLAVPMLVAAEEPSLFRIGTGGPGGTYYPVGRLLAQALSNPEAGDDCRLEAGCGVPHLLAVAQTANGSLANANAISQGTLESGFIQSDVGYWAYSGSGIFQQSKPLRELRAIAALYLESVHLVTRRGAGIYSIKDLVGKRVALDEPGSGTLIDASILLAAYGVDQASLDVSYVKPEQAMSRFRSGELDAFFMVAGYPTASIERLASTNGIELIPITGPEARQILAEYPYFSRDSIPAGTYAGVERETPTLSVGAQWVTSERMADELIYDITRTLWSEATRRLLHQGHVRGRDITLSTALDSVSLPLHRGAARFYREQGMLNGGE